jgi:hypothetical protein
MSHLDVLNGKTLKRCAAFQLLRGPKINVCEKLFSATKRAVVWRISCRHNLRGKFNYKCGQFKFENVVIYLGMCVNDTERGLELF